MTPVNALWNRLVFLSRKSALWALVGAVLGTAGGGFAIHFDLASSIPLFGLVVQSKAAGWVAGVFSVLLVFGPIFAALEEAGCVVVLLVLAVFGGLILWLGVAAVLVVFPYVRGAVCGFLAGGSAAGGIAFLVQAVCRGTPTNHTETGTTPVGGV